MTPKVAYDSARTRADVGLDTHIRGHCLCAPLAAARRGADDLRFCGRRHLLHYWLADRVAVPLWHLPADIRFGTCCHDQGAGGRPQHPPIDAGRRLGAVRELHAPSVYAPCLRWAPWNVLENPHFLGALLLLLVMTRLDRAAVDLDLPVAQSSSRAPSQ